MTQAIQLLTNAQSPREEGTSRSKVTQTNMKAAEIVALTATEQQQNKHTRTREEQ